MKTLSNLRREVSEAKKMKGEDPCWTGYKMLGTKNKGGKQVPNCIPEEIDLDEAVEVQSDHYKFAHGKAPSGEGSWMFTPHKSINFSKHKEGEHYISVHGKYGEAKKKAQAWAKSKGHGIIKVAEEVELDEGSFKYHMNKAIAANDRGDDKKTAYHLNNARTAKFAMKTADYAKNRELLDKHKQMSEEVVAEESDAYEKAQENKRSADDAKNQGDMFAHHMHMSDHHENLSQWHYDKGRSNVADSHAKKSEEHHEKAMEMKDKQGVSEEVESIDEISTDGYYTAAAKSRMNAAVKVASSMGQDKQAKTKLDARNRGMGRVEKRTQDDMKKANSGPQRPRPEKKVSDAEARGYGQGRYMGDSYEPSNSTQIYEKNKDAGEYDYEGDMSKSQLRSIIANAQQIHDMLEDNTNMAEWVQSKITLAADYISTVADYMQSEVKEEVEQTDESRKSFYINSRARKDPAVALARKQRRNFRNPPMVRGKNVNLENVSEALSARDRLIVAMNREKEKREAHEKAREARETATKLSQQTTQPQQKIKEGIASLISKNIKKVTATKLTPQQKADIRLNK